MTRQKTNTKTYAVIGLIASSIFLVIFNMKDVLFGAPIAVHTASDGSSVSDVVLPVSGTTSHAKLVTINGRSVSVDRTGAFADEVILSPGYNVVEVAVVDRFGKEKTKTLHIVATDTKAVAQLSTNTYPQ